MCDYTEERWFEAATEGDVGTLMTIAKYGWDVNRRDRYGTTALHRAAREGRSAAVAFLLRRGADPAARDQTHRRTPLHRAVYYGHVAAARELLAGGAPVDATSADGWTPLHVACWHARGELVGPLLEHGAEVNARSADGATPAHYVLRWNPDGEARVKSTLSLLLRRGANPNASDDDGNTPLALSVKNLWPGSVKLLLAAGGDANAVADHRTSSRFDFGSYNRPDYARVPLVHAAVGNLEVLRTLLDAGANLFGATKAGQGVLHRAAWGAGSSEVVRFLLDAGVAVNGRDALGWTALHCAAAARRPDVIRLLVSADAEVNVTDAWGLTPLHVAAGTPPPPGVLHRHCCITPPARLEENPLWWVRGREAAARKPEPQWPEDAECVGAYVETVRAFLEAGADRGATDAIGRTPAEVTGFETVRELLKNQEKRSGDKPRR